jgi:hypothetical protein
MSDTEHRNLVRDYAANRDLDLIPRIITSSLRRGGPSFPEFREIGVPWSEIKKYLHWFNPNIPSPQEVTAYKAFVTSENPDWSPTFIERIEFVVHADPQDQWSPEWPEGMITMHPSFWGWVKPDVEGLSPRKLRKLGLDPQKPVWKDVPHSSKWGSLARISFWGADDSGMERDMTEEDPEPLLILEDILRRLPPQVSQQWLRDNGFVTA